MAQNDVKPAQKWTTVQHSSVNMTTTCFWQDGCRGGGHFVRPVAIWHSGLPALGKISEWDPADSYNFSDVGHYHKRVVVYKWGFWTGSRNTASIFMSFLTKSDARNTNLKWKSEPEVVLGAILNPEGPK